MIEDKLTHGERIRLECLAQANAAAAPFESTEERIHCAEQFEKFVRDEEADPQSEPILGLATTADLLNELMARVHMSSDTVRMRKVSDHLEAIILILSPSELAYRTVDQ